MAALKISRKHRPRRNQPYDLLTWGQIKTLTNQVKSLISQQEMPQSPKNLPIAMLTCRNHPPPAHRSSRINKSDVRFSWVYLPNPPLLQVIKWREKGPMTSPVCPLPGALTPWGRGKTNISLGLPLCLGPGKIKHKRRPTNLGFRPASKTRLSDIAALSLSVYHVYY